MLNMDIKNMDVKELKETLKEQQQETERLGKAIASHQKLTTQRINLRIAKLSHRKIDEEIAAIGNVKEIEQEHEARLLIADDCETRIKHIETSEAAKTAFFNFNSKIEKCTQSKELLLSSLENFNQAHLEVVQAGKKSSQFLTKNNGAELSFTESEYKKALGKFQGVIAVFKYNIRTEITYSNRIHELEISQRVNCD